MSPSIPGDDPDASPIDRFRAWWRAAKAHDGIIEPDAMVVSSVDTEGRPSSRVVLLRGFDARGFVFYTNLESRKGVELRRRPVAALNFYWAHLERQVRVEGVVSQVEDAEADAYFAGRPRESQLGAWASAQSRALADEGALARALDEVRARFGDGPVPRPPRWSGLRVAPEVIELWTAGAFRLHRRERYTLDGAVYRRTLLFP